MVGDKLGYTDAMFHLADTKLKSRTRGEWIDEKDRWTAFEEFVASTVRSVFEDRFDDDRIGEDPLLKRVLRYQVALNDWVDVGEKIEPGSGREILGNQLKKAKIELDEYFSEPTTDAEEKTRRKELQKQFNIVMAEVEFVEHNLDNYRSDAEGNYEKIRNSKEIVNALETLLNISICTGPDTLGRYIESPNGQLSLEELSEKYKWILDPNVKDITSEQKSAKMLYFATMSMQMAVDVRSFREDKPYGILKPMTYLTEVLDMDLEEASKIIVEEENKYLVEAKNLGVPSGLVKIMNGLSKVTMSVMHFFDTVKLPPEQDKRLKDRLAEMGARHLVLRTRNQEGKNNLE